MRPQKICSAAARAVRLGPSGHLHGLGVVADHAGHELDVSRGVRTANAVAARLLDAAGGRLRGHQVRGDKYTKHAPAQAARVSGVS